MTTAPNAAGQPGRDALTTRIFRVLYPDFDLCTINRTYVVVPKGTAWFAGTSLGDIARQISDYDHPGPAASPAGPGRECQLPVRPRAGDGGKSACAD